MLLWHCKSWRLSAKERTYERHVKAWQHAYELCCASAQECVSHSLTVWAPVAKFSLEGAIRSHRELGMTKEAEWKMLALAYLRVCSKGAKDQQADELEWVMTGLRNCECVAESESSQPRVARESLTS